MKEARKEVVADERWAVEHFDGSLALAKRVWSQIGWEGDGAIYSTCLPTSIVSDNSYLSLFFVKQQNNGSCFFATELYPVWLQSDEIINMKVVEV